MEEMAGMDILCSDKTGTLTLNQLSVDKNTVLVTSPGMGCVFWSRVALRCLIVDFTAQFIPRRVQHRSKQRLCVMCRVEEALKYGALSANISSQEPIDVVMHESCEGHQTLWDSYKQVKFVPFNPTDKYTIASVVPNDGSPPYRLMKGAPQVISDCPSSIPLMLAHFTLAQHIILLCLHHQRVDRLPPVWPGATSCRLQVVLRHSANKEAIRTVVEEKIVEFANRGYRALGLSRAQGLEGMQNCCHDSLRLSSRQSGPDFHAVQTCRRAELRVHLPAAALRPASS